jgi:hypothetical protein
MTSLAGITSAPEFIDSVQVTDDHAPRFRIPARYERPEWAEAAAVEAAGGVAAEVRVFLDEQITTGDVLFDLAPGFGFVALSAATAPNGVATVFVAGFTEPHLTELQDAAADAGAWVEGLSDDPWAELDLIVDTRLEAEGRIFVHVAPSELSHACAALGRVIASSRLLALCVSAPIQPGQWTAAREALERAGLRACVLADRDGSVMLMPVSVVPASCLIAVPADLFEDAMRTRTCMATRRSCMPAGIRGTTDCRSSRRTHARDTAWPARTCCARSRRVGCRSHSSRSVASIAH